MKDKLNSNHGHGFLIASAFKDIDRFAEVGRSWDVDFRQLDPGNLDARLLQVSAGTVQLMEARFNRRIEQQGCSPPDSYTIAVPLGTQPRLVWRRRQVPAGSILIYRPGSEIDGASRPGFQVIAVSIEAAMFHHLAENLGYPEVAELADSIDLVSLPKVKLQRLQTDLRQVCSTLRREQTGSIPSHQRVILEHRLATMMIHALAAGLPAPRPSPIGDRQRALRTALDFMHSNPHDALSVRDLCHASGASERVLQYAFREYFDVTPGAYLKTFRLVAIRRQLRSSSLRKGMITNLANDWGFWHMGQFAADYRRQFGELPSETVHHHSRSL